MLRSPDGAAPPHGLLEVGYQIGCGIDMSTSQGVTISGSAGITPSIGLAGIESASPLPEFPVLRGADAFDRSVRVASLQAYYGTTKQV